MEIDQVPKLGERVAPAEAAFGERPGVNVRFAVDEFEHWQRAVALAARGYYARARHEVEAVRGDEFVHSLALSARASWRRQLGWHAAAAELDGPALRIALALPAGPRRVEAVCDAMTGLAADGIGQGRPGATQSMLGRVAHVLASESVDDFWRQRVRLDWVAAETALALGDARSALPRARSAVSRAVAAGALRHEIKSQLLVAAATAGCGDLEESTKQAAKVALRCAENGLLPLEWAASMLLSGVHPESAGMTRAQQCANEIERRGGRFR